MSSEKSLLKVCCAPAASYPDSRRAASGHSNPERIMWNAELKGVPLPLGKRAEIA